MLKLILKNLWSRRRRNGWLLAELILVCALSWAIFDPMIVFTHDRRIPLGYDADRLCMLSTAMLTSHAPGYDGQATDSASLVSAYFSLVDRVEQHPAVQSATPVLGFSYLSSGGSWTNSYFPAGDTLNSWSAYMVPFIPHTRYFETYGLRPGKGLAPEQLSDRDYGPDEVVTSANTLNLFFGTDNPQGLRFWNYHGEDTTYTDIVGAVGALKYKSDGRPTPVVFRPTLRISTEDIPSSAYIVLRLKEGESMARFLHDFAPWMQQNLRAGNLYVRNLKPYRQVIEEDRDSSSTPVYRRGALVATFFLVNLCLGVAGTFWLQTRTRREEVGVMLSFGSTPGRIRALLLGEGAVLTTLAVLAGCFLYYWYGKMEGLAAGVGSWMPVTETCWTDVFWQHFLVVSLVVYTILLVVVSVGVFIPAWKISRVPPTEALHDE